MATYLQGNSAQNVGKLDHKEAPVEHNSATLQTHTCPNCGRAVQFDAEHQSLKCPYCDAELSLGSLAQYQEAKAAQSAEDQMEWDTSTSQVWAEQELDGMQAYSCQSCGGQIIGTAETIATTCPFCDNPVVILDKVEGDLRPDYVIPFQITKEEAKAALSQFVTNKFLLPKVFKDEQHIDEIRGIYVPFWLFDAKAKVDGQYRTQTVRTWSDFHYSYTEVSHYLNVRSGEMAFEHLTVDGSSLLSDQLMQSIEPFDFSQAVDFQTAYLAGYLADKYDVIATAGQEIANERIKQSATQQVRSTLAGMGHLTVESETVQLADGQYHYALYPVWLLTTSWQGNRYTFAMNGQTGRFVGDLPVDKATYWKAFAGMAIGVAAVAFIVFYFLLNGLTGGSL